MGANKIPKATNKANMNVQCFIDESNPVLIHSTSNLQTIDATLKLPTYFPHELADSFK